MAQITLNSSGVASNGVLKLQSNGTTDAVTIDASQNVGIGTSSPGAKLDVIGRSSFTVDGSGSTTPLILRNNNTASTTIVKLGFDSNGTVKASINAAVYNNDFMTFNVGSDTERMRIDSAGNVGIGTSSPVDKLHVSGAVVSTSNTVLTTTESAIFDYNPGQSAGRMLAYKSTGSSLFFYTNPNAGGLTERMRIDSSGNLLVGTTSSILSGELTIAQRSSSTSPIVCDMYNASTKALKVGWYGGEIGSISINAGGTAVAYNTSSDYRLKHDIAPMTGALAKVTALKPVTYKWNADNSESQGFIAHELQAVVPECVTGTKDAVDAEGKPQYQGIDTSFLVATLTAALKELNAKFDSYVATHP